MTHPCQSAIFFIFPFYRAFVHSIGYINFHGNNAIFKINKADRAWQKIKTWNKLKLFYFKITSKTGLLLHSCLYCKIVLKVKCFEISVHLVLCTHISWTTDGYSRASCTTQKTQRFWTASIALIEALQSSIALYL